MRLEDSRIVTKENRSKWIVFTTVRNHYDALVSWVCKRYKNRTQTPWDLEAFKTALRANVWVEGHSLWGRHMHSADVVMRYESLELNLESVLGFRLVIPPINVSEQRKGRPYREFYTDETREYVAERFGGEMRRFGYGF